ncbi:DUF2256 domain-containing protein [Acinetobacter modestus]|uniref:DUF2256 domain-containing protein n=1 Tax=Acinetobacter modestus TaxID=1776740 RepID=UPI0009D795CF|nr:DUF2256 domain-containing protein [Acinetobacter modestus]
MHKKIHLPEKVCLNCHLTFSWRKKWERCWNEVQYCSKKCKSQAKINSKNQASN